MLIICILLPLPLRGQESPSTGDIVIAGGGAYLANEMCSYARQPQSLLDGRVLNHIRPNTVAFGIQVPFLKDDAYSIARRLQRLPPDMGAVFIHNSRISFARPFVINRDVAAVLGNMAPDSSRTVFVGTCRQGSAGGLRIAQSIDVTDLLPEQPVRLITLNGTARDLVQQIGSVDANELYSVTELVKKADGTIAISPSTLSPREAQVFASDKAARLADRLKSKCTSSRFAKASTMASGVSPAKAASGLLLPVGVMSERIRRDIPLETREQIELTVSGTAQNLWDRTSGPGKYWAEDFVKARIEQEEKNHQWFMDNCGVIGPWRMPGAILEAFPQMINNAHDYGNFLGPVPHEI